MVSYNVISELIVNILRVLLIRKMMELFLPPVGEDRKKVGTGFVLPLSCPVFSTYQCCMVSVTIWGWWD